MSREICIEASRVLEKAYLAYKAYLPARATDTLERFPVYLFATEKGYLAYSKGVTGTMPMRSAGLYSPVLRQLLIWNLPRRIAMMQTVRHEGLHQYIDRVMPSPARWFNEGHAEYFEAARTKGSWRLGLVRRDHIKTLGLSPKMSLEAFMNQSAYVFLRNARFNYAFSWLLVHYLHHGNPKNKAILKSLFQNYIAGKAHAQVWEIATKNINMLAFESGLWQHFKKLGGVHQPRPKPKNGRYGQ
ncbi:MAG: DUF1570 domain-containing protein [Planctomycetota bacterium]